MYDINPDFESRDKFIQPQTSIFRSQYRSPIDSEGLNLYDNSVVEDIEYLYAKLEAIKTDFESKLGDLYDDGAIQFSADTILDTIRDYALELEYIREEIENLK